MIVLLRRLRARWHLIRHHGDHLNRRVEVENILIQCASGKRPLPDQAECMRLEKRSNTTSLPQPSGCAVTCH